MMTDEEGRLVTLELAIEGRQQRMATVERGLTETQHHCEQPGFLGDWWHVSAILYHAACARQLRDVREYVTIYDQVFGGAS